jgi:hypothetical protein
LLQGHGVTQPLIDRFVDGAHAAATQAVHNPIPALQNNTGGQRESAHAMVTHTHLLSLKIADCRLPIANYLPHCLIGNRQSAMNEGFDSAGLKVPVWLGRRRLERKRLACSVRGFEGCRWQARTLALQSGAAAPVALRGATLQTGYRNRHADSEGRREFVLKAAWMSE